MLIVWFAKLPKAAHYCAYCLHEIQNEQRHCCEFLIKYLNRMTTEACQQVSKIRYKLTSRF
jgi:hypothetical protein